MSAASSSRVWTANTPTTPRSAPNSGWAGALPPNCTTSYFYGIDTATGSLDEYINEGQGGFGMASLSDANAAVSYESNEGDMSPTAAACHDAVDNRWMVSPSAFNSERLK